MKKILYITNIEVPYRVKFFNQLSERTDLTVLYELKKSSNRDMKWAKSVDSSHKKYYLGGLKVSGENSFSFRILKYLNTNYDDIVISCFNSPVQMLSMIYLRLKRKRYLLSLDGEQFIGEKGVKNAIKKFFIKGAYIYLVAGEVSSENIKKIVGDKEVFSYYFGSYDKEELARNNAMADANKGSYVLVVGQYYDYKGLDTAVRIARLDHSIKYRFVGMGKRTELFVKERLLPDDTNIEVIPFLQKEELNKEYNGAGVLLLPSKRECWGLVINEAASFGTPIVATIGSGAAQEFLRHGFEKYLFDCDDIIGMHGAIKELLNQKDDMYSKYLIETSRKYNIENMVESHIKALSE